MSNCASRIYSIKIVTGEDNENNNKHFAVVPQRTRCKNVLILRLHKALYECHNIQYMYALYVAHIQRRSESAYFVARLMPVCLRIPFPRILDID